MPKTVYKCEFCGTVYNDRENAASCERSHKAVVEITAQHFLNAEVSGPFPQRIVCRAASGETVHYERRKGK